MTREEIEFIAEYWINDSVKALGESDAIDWKKVAASRIAGNIVYLDQQSSSEMSTDAFIKMADGAEIRVFVDPKTYYQQTQLEFIDHEGIRYWYEYRLAHDGEICLDTKDPKRYCNGTYTYSSKDPGSGKEFVVINQQPQQERSAEEILEAECGFFFSEILKIGALEQSSLDILKKWVIKAMHEFRDQGLREVTDKEIEEWCKMNVESRFTGCSYMIQGAKAMRDGKIKSSNK